MFELQGGTFQTKSGKVTVEIVDGKFLVYSADRTPISDKEKQEYLEQFKIFNKGGIKELKREENQR